MREKVYQISIDQAHFKRALSRLSMVVTAHSDYAESKNINQWDDPISVSLANDLYDNFEALEQYLDNLIFKDSKEVKK
jgi:putative effector of murein hydrolase